MRALLFPSFLLAAVAAVAAVSACGGSIDSTPLPDAGLRADGGAGSAPDASRDSPLGDGSGGPDATVDAGASDPTAATGYLLNPAHTSTLDDPTLAPPLNLAWSRDFGSVVSYPVVAQGRVYLVLSDETSGASTPLRLVALDVSTGATVWGPVALPATQYGGGHAYDGGRVFVAYGTGDGCGVTAYDAATGKAAWTTSLGSQCLMLYEPTAYGGVVYVNGGPLVALDEGTGKILWSKTVEMSGGPPAVTDDAVFVSTGCTGQSAFHRLTGAPLWTDPSCDGSGFDAPVISAGRDYVVDFADGSVILDTKTGAPLGTFSGASYPAVDGTVAVTNARSSPGLQAVDVTTNRVLWTFDGDGQLNMTPVIAGGAVYVGSDNGTLFAVDEASGAPLWSATYGGGTPSLAAGQGHLFAWGESSTSITAYARLPDAGAVPDAGSSCSPPFGYCGSTCVDLATDPKNCGACGAPCTGTCAGGHCTEPIVLAANEYPNSIALDASYVYWTNYSSGEIRRVAKSGGQPTTLDSSPGTYPWSIAVDAANVYWTAPNFYVGGADAGVMQRPLDGGARIALGTQLDEPTNIAVSATTVFWTPSGGTDVVQTVPIGGGTVARFVAGQAAGGAITIDANNLYWSTSSATYQAPLVGGQPLQIGPASPALAVDGAYVYLATSNGSAASVLRVPIGGGPSVTLASSRPPSIVAVAVDAARVYWLEGEGTIGMGAVAAVDKSGGTPVVLASGLQDPSALAVDDADIYFANTVAGQVEKIAK
jgi:outer membrane protein assembly factor BamB